MNNYFVSKMPFVRTSVASETGYKSLAKKKEGKSDWLRKSVSGIARQKVVRIADDGDGERAEYVLPLQMAVLRDLRRALRATEQRKVFVAMAILQHRGYRYAKCPRSRWWAHKDDLHLMRFNRDIHPTIVGFYQQTPHVMHAHFDFTRSDIVSSLENVLWGIPRPTTRPRGAEFGLRRGKRNPVVVFCPR